MISMHGIIGFKIIFGGLHESFYLTTQQSLCEQITTIIGLNRACPISHGQGYMTVRWSFHLQRHLVVFCQHCRQATHAHCILTHAVHATEQQSVCPDSATSIKHRYLGNTSIQAFLGNHNLFFAHHALIPHRTILHDSQSQRHITQSHTFHLDHQPTVFLTGPQVHPLGLTFRQFNFCALTITPQKLRTILLAYQRFQCQHSTASMFGRCFSHDIAISIPYHQLSFPIFTEFIYSLESNPLSRTIHPVSSFRIKGNHCSWILLLQFVITS